MNLTNGIAKTRNLHRPIAGLEIIVKKKTGRTRSGSTHNLSIGTMIKFHAIIKGQESCVFGWAAGFISRARGLSG